MIHPSIEELSKGKFNRYEIAVAAAKCAHLVTDEYVKQRENAEKAIAAKETEKSVGALIKKEYRDEKAVKTAINRINKGVYVILKSDEQTSAEKKLLAEIEDPISE